MPAARTSRLCGSCPKPALPAELRITCPADRSAGSGSVDVDGSIALFSEVTCSGDPRISIEISAEGQLADEPVELELDRSLNLGNPDGGWSDTIEASGAIEAFITASYDGGAPLPDKEGLFVVDGDQVTSRSPFPVTRTEDVESMPATFELTCGLRVF